MKRACVLLMLAACAGPDDPPAKLAEFPGVTAIDVSLPQWENSTGLEYALSAALGDRDLPAYFSHNAPPKSDHLAISGKPPLFHVALSDPQGREMAAFEAVLYAGDTKQELRSIANRIADEVAGILLPPTTLQRAQPNIAHVAVLQGQGAPGDGDEALARAMTQILGGKVPLDPAPSPANYRISVKVARKPESAGEIITLEWTISDPKHREIGHIGQSHSVALGSLDHHWGGTAYDAALAAASALLPIIGSLPPEPPP